MAITALRLLPDGTTEKVRIEEIVEANRYDDYICDGQNPRTGQPCRAAVFPVMREGAPYFRVNVRHICGCSNDESEAATIRRHLDVTGRTTTIADLMAACGRAEREGNERRLSHRDVEPVTGNETDHVDDDDNDRRIIREARNPKNLKEICALLIKSNLNDIYTQVPVGDLIVDHRNVNEYRQNGLRDGQMAVVLCSRIGRKRIDALVPERVNEDVIVGDAYAYEDRATPLLLFIDGSKAAYRKIFDSPKGNIIAIFAKWHSHPDAPNAYVCDHINAGQVFVAARSFFDQ